MKIHVLPGDAQVAVFGRTRLEGETIVCRECLVEGDVAAANLDEFWAKRAAFIENAYGGSREEYDEKVARELAKLTHLSGAAEVNLWFEYELFCQANMWFCLFLLRDTGAAVYRVAPVVRPADEIWKGFGGLDAAALKSCYEQREKFSPAEIRLGAELWQAFQKRDHRRLEVLSKTPANCFPYLSEVCRAEIEKNFRPKAVLNEIIESGRRDFEEIMPEFSRRAGVYGFGDAQVRRILSAENA